MFGSEILDVAIGLALLYALLSVLASTLRESIEGLYKSRGRTLERALQEMLGKEGARALYEHPLISGLYQGKYGDGKRNLPSYIPDSLFTIALYDIAVGATDEVARDAAATAAFVSTTEARHQLASNALVARTKIPQLVGTALNNAQFDTRRAMATIAESYRGSMDRAAGWYRRETHWMIMAIAAVVTVGLNANTLTVGQFLYRHKAVRDALVARAGTLSSSVDATARTESRAVQAQIESLGLPLGWPAAGPTVGYIVRQFPGWIMTVFAVSLGAPFWFDVLNKFMVIRSTVKPHEKSPEEGSEDRPARDGNGRTSVVWAPLLAAQGSVPASTTAPQLGPGPLGELHAPHPRR